MTPRETMQLAYELAFFPPRLNQMWREHRAGRLSCELRAVNHRFLEIGFRLPDELRALEPQLRERIAELEADKQRLEQELAKARFVVDVQAKLHVLLETISESTERDTGSTK